MNLTVIRQMIILSLLVGGAYGILTLIPFIDVLMFFGLMFLTAPIIIWFMLNVELLKINDNKGSIIAGSIIGFFAFLGFCVIYLPLVMLLGRGLGLYNQYGISIFLGAGSFGVIVLLIMFMAVLSAVTNAFGGFITYYLSEFIKSTEKK